MKIPRLLCIIALAALCLSGCKELEVEYDSPSSQSINSFSALKHIWKEQFAFRRHRNRTNRLDECDLIMHIVSDLHSNPFAAAGVHIETDIEIEDEELDIDERSPTEWLRDWLSEKDQRQFVLVLRDGNIAPQLCREWASEFDQAAQKAASKDGPEAAERLKKQAEVLREIAVTQSTRPLVNSGAETSYDFFDIQGRIQQSHKQVDGYLAKNCSAAPHTLFSRSSLEHDLAEALLYMDDRQFILNIPIKNSRLLVIANASILVNGALVDKNARQILSNLNTFIADWEPQSAAWLQTMTAGYNNPPPPPNIIMMLFTKEPFNYAIIHGLIALILFLCWRATWLGRRQSQRQDIAEQFQQHVDALARHLQQGQRHNKQYQAIAKAIGKDDTSQHPHNDADAIDCLERLYQQEDSHQR